MTNEELKRLIQLHGFQEDKQKRTGQCFELYTGVYRTIISMPVDWECQLYIYKRADLIVSCSKGVCFESLKFLLKFHTGHELKEVKKYDYKSCMERVEGIVWIDSDSDIISDPRVGMPARAQHRNVLPSVEAANTMLAGMQLHVVVDRINKDFPKKRREVSEWPHVYGGEVAWLTYSVNPFEIYTSEGVMAFESEPSNLELLKQFQGLE